MDELFLKLSGVLTGFDNLNPEAATLYHKKLSESNADGLESLLLAFKALLSNPEKDVEELVREKIWTDDTLKIVCKSIILIWYNAAIMNANNVVIWQAPPEFYYDALLWRAVEAHPPAISGGYFGYWRYAPEN
ncbi:MAG TPA: sugar dehydrogenase complex small subunit [Mucilaginibacter sp.]|nr:sugar dehydrogenase complex small subunit [Mucilaginibacter sp.]